jgi:hypothetical protein
MWRNPANVAVPAAAGYIKTVNTAAGEKRIRFARKKYILLDF